MRTRRPEIIMNRRNSTMKQKTHWGKTLAWRQILQTCYRSQHRRLIARKSNFGGLKICEQGNQDLKKVTLTGEEYFNKGKHDEDWLQEMTKSGAWRRQLIWRITKGTFYSQTSEWMCMENLATRVEKMGKKCRETMQTISKEITAVDKNELENHK